MRVNHQQSSNIIQDYIHFHKNIYQSNSTFFLNLSSSQCYNKQLHKLFIVIFLSVNFWAAQAIKHSFINICFAYQGHLLYIWIVFLCEADINDIMFETKLDCSV